MIPISQTLPDVNLDEILASLDGDTRQYLQLLLTGGAEGLHGEGRNLSDVLRRFKPTARDLARVNDALAQRRENIRRAVHNFSLVVDELGSKDDQIANFVAELQRRVRDAGAPRTPSLRATLRELPSTLRRDAEGARQHRRDGAELGPTLEALRPGARALGPSLRDTRPFLRESTPIIRDEIRPFVRAARPAVSDLRPAAARPRGRHARPHAHVQGRQRAAQHAGLQPARRPRRGLPVLALVGEPPRQHGVRHAGRARPDPPRHRRRVVQVAGRARQRRAQQRAARRAGRSCSPAAARRARTTPRRRGRWLMPKQAPTFARLAAMVVFALSCFGLLLFLWLAFGGAIPLKPKGYRFQTRSPRRRSSPARPTCGSPACRSARSRTSSPTSRPAARSW